MNEKEGSVYVGLRFRRIRLQRGEEWQQVEGAGTREGTGGLGKGCIIPSAIQGSIT